MRGSIKIFWEILMFLQTNKYGDEAADSGAVMNIKNDAYARALYSEPGLIGGLR